VPSLRDCQETCKTLWGLEVEIDDLRTVVDELVTGGRLEVGKFAPRGFYQ
jgi:hypothetical protein